MDQPSFEILRDYLKESSGLILDENKIYLLESRLMPLIQEFELTNLSELAVQIKSKSNPKLSQKVMEAMTTNETSFMRDMKPFQRFEKIILPYLLENRTQEKKSVFGVQPVPVVRNRIPWLCC